MACAKDLDGSYPPGLPLASRSKPSERRHMFSLSYGAATFICPIDLSDEDRADVVAWLELIVVQMRRKASDTERTE